MTRNQGWDCPPCRAAGPGARVRGMGGEDENRMVYCPICRRPAGRLHGPHTPEFPFCSPRCRQQDLANWAGGKYVISTPAPFAEGGEDRPPETPEDET